MKINCIEIHIGSCCFIYEHNALFGEFTNSKHENVQEISRKEISTESELVLRITICEEHINDRKSILYKIRRWSSVREKNKLFHLSLILLFHNDVDTYKVKS